MNSRSANQIKTEIKTGECLHLDLDLDRDFNQDVKTITTKNDRIRKNDHRKELNSRKPRSTCNTVRANVEPRDRPVNEINPKPNTQELSKSIKHGTNEHNSRNKSNLKSMRMRNNLKCLVINLQGLTNKKTSLAQLNSDIQSDIVIASETWLHNDIKSSELLLDLYDVYRRDRVNKIRGGAMIAIKKNLESEMVYTSKTTESIYCKINMKNRTPIIIGSVYRPPNPNLQKKDEICRELTEIKANNKKALFWVGGDFNLPDIDWQIDTITGHQYPSALNTKFLDTINELGWNQIVNFSTRKNNILDLFLTNNPGLIEEALKIPGLGDHEAALITSKINPNRKKMKPRRILLWNRCDPTIIKEKMLRYQNSFIKSFNLNSNIEEMWGSIKENLISIMEENVPTKITSTQFQQPWFNRTTKQLVRKRERWFKIMKKNNSEKVQNKYKEIKKEAQQACRSAHAEYVNNMISSDKTNKKPWTYIKNKNQEKFGIPDLKKDNSILQDPKDKADLLNGQFSSVFSNPQPKIEKDTKMNNIQSTKMQHIKVTKKGVYNLLINIKEHKATGPDKIPGKILKMCAEEIVDVLVLFFQASLNQGKVPEDWKKANIVPLFKKGDKHKAENYRPVSLTSVTCKLLEHIIYSNIMGHLEKHDILNNIQHGFRQKRSCETQLITTLNDFSNTLNARGQTDAILLDFSKAFDKVDHLGLLIKLENYGISDSLLEWTKSFLIGRTQRVIVEGIESDPKPVLSGVPQGTVLGPLFFLIYINDIDVNLTEGTKLRLFADDSLLYRQIDSNKDYEILQNDLNKLEQWESKWKMEFHPGKCQVLKITRKHNPIESYYHLHSQTLETTRSAKYLGINIDDKLQWTDHIRSVCQRANKLLAFLKRNISSCPQHIKTKCYNTFVKPVLEYGCCVWDPYYQCHIDNIEKIQKNAGRFVTNNYNYNNGNTKINMNKLNWKPLEEHRARNKVTLLYKAINNQAILPLNEFKMTDSRTRSGVQVFTIPSSKLNCHMQSYFPSTFRLWNKLPNETKLSLNVEDFKNRLKHTTLKTKY